MRRFVMIDVEYEANMADHGPFTKAEISKSIIDDIVSSIREVLPVIQVDIINEGQANIFESESSNLP